MKMCKWLALTIVLNVFHPDVDTVAKTKNLRDRTKKIEENNEALVEKKVKKKKKLKKPSPWFPSWEKNDFSITIDPLFGMSSERIDEKETGVDAKKGVTSELGLGVSVRNIPLFPGNPGYDFSPRVGLAAGRQDYALKKDGKWESYHAKFNRNWYGLDNWFYFNSFRQKLSIVQGELKFSEDRNDRITNQIIESDSGILILSFLSGHMSYLKQVVRDQTRKQKQLDENDYWLHANVFFWNRFSVDMGPGQTMSQIYELVDDDWVSVGEGQSRYIKVLSHIDLTLLHIELRSDYVLSADETLMNHPTNIKVPTRPITSPQTIAALPEDTLKTLAVARLPFLKVFDLSWYYQKVTVNFREKAGSRESVEQYGVKTSLSISI